MTTQLLDFVKEVQTRFRLNPAECLELTQFAEYQSRALSEENVVQSIYQRALGFLGRSREDYLLDLLKQRAVDLILDHFGQGESPIPLETRVNALARFVLNYLITIYSISKEQPVWRITESVWREFRLDTISFDEVVDRAVSGDGTRLGQMEVADIQRCIRRKREEIDRLYHTITLKDTTLSAALTYEKQQIMQKYSLDLNIINAQANVSPKLYSSDPNSIYIGLKTMRKVCNEFHKLAEKWKETKYQEEQMK